MPFSLRKAINSTHRHPSNRILHCIGGPIYVAGIALILDNLLFGIRYPITIYAIIMCSTAISFFLIGHKIEGNLRAMTILLLFRYLIRSGKSALHSSAR
jgi:uncharacterized membrane protein YGL010W